MNIVWVTNAPIIENQGNITSDVASVRYRMIIPAKELKKRGHIVNTLFIPRGPLSEKHQNILAKADITVFGKTLDKISVDIAKSAINRGKTVVVDVCDDLFNDKTFGQYNVALAELATVVTGNSNRMAELLAKYSKNRIVAIPDPFESDEKQAYFSPQMPRLKLLWYGHIRNINALFASINNIGAASTRMPLELNIVTNKNDQLDEYIADFNRRYEAVFRLAFEKWSVDATNRALSQCDLVVIPNDKTKTSDLRSANRVIESIRAGRFVVATAIDSYNEFAQWISIGDNLGANILSAIANPEATAKKIAAAQQYVAKTFSPDCIADRWETLFTSLKLN